MILIYEENHMSKKTLQLNYNGNLLHIKLVFTILNIYNSKFIILHKTVFHLSDQRQTSSNHNFVSQIGRCQPKTHTFETPKHSPEHPMLWVKHNVNVG